MGAAGRVPCQNPLKLWKKKMITSFQCYSRYLSSLYFQARELEKDFGYSGAPSMPPERALKVSGCEYNNKFLSNTLM